MKSTFLNINSLSVAFGRKKYFGRKEVLKSFSFGLAAVQIKEQLFHLELRKQMCCHLSLYNLTGMAQLSGTSLGMATYQQPCGIFLAKNCGRSKVFTTKQSLPKNKRSDPQGKGLCHHLTFSRLMRITSKMKTKLLLLKTIVAPKKHIIVI